MAEAGANASPVDDGHCVACGPKSEIGLHMRFRETGPDAVESKLILPQPFQGWQGVAHGGVVAMLLDETMAYAAATRRALGMTAEMKMRFRRPVPLGAVAAAQRHGTRSQRDRRGRHRAGKRDREFRYQG